MPDRTKGALVAFSGVDGAGKSTQIGLLVESLQAAGRRPRYLWSRGGYTPGFEAFKALLRRLSRGRVLPHSGHSPRRTRAFRQPWKRRLWLRLALLDLIWLYAVRIRIWLRLGRDVICDRYWQDTLIDFRLNFPQEQVERWPLWRLLRRLAPAPDIAFLLIVPVEESVRRSRQKDEPFPDTPRTLEQRLQHYRLLAAEGHWRVLDGRSPPGNLAAAISRALCAIEQPRVLPQL